MTYPSDHEYDSPHTSDLADADRRFFESQRSDFSLSDAFNEAGEPLMSPEQIRAEMDHQHDPPEYCDQCGFRRGGPCPDDYEEDEDED